ncbi:MAG: radical SAM protein [Candidatus Gracilibacteria bacterium]|nr:radical SAM protein [Candidatus Gracilibacteria bacterium]
MTDKYIINWELSLACNLDCSFCSQKERRNLNNKIPSLENIYQIIDNLPNNTHISFLGGETLMLPNIIDIFKKLEERGISYEITTNGILLDKFFGVVMNNPTLNSLPKIREGGYNKIEQLKHLTQINISIDGYGDFHDISRGKKGLFNKLKKVIPELINIKNITISTVISPNLTNENIVKLHLWLNSIGIKEHKLIYMMNFSKIDVENSKNKIKELKIGLPGSEKLDNNVLKNNFLEKLSLLKNLGNNNPSLYSFPKIREGGYKKIQITIEPIALFKKGKISCKQLDKQLRIDENGKLSICEFITNNFDDISKIKLNDAIKNNDFIEFKKAIKSNFPLDICKTCCKLYNENSSN